MIFTEPPKDFQKQLDVVACFVEHDGKFLMLKRHADKPNGGCWGLPAGKVDVGESLTLSMCRELQEETDIVCEAGAFMPLQSVLVRHGEVDFEYHMFKLVLPEQPPVTVNGHEHVAHDWLLPKESLQLQQVADQADCTRLVYGV